MKNAQTDFFDPLLDTPVLMTKLHIPSRTAETMTRPRLIDRLSRSAGDKLTLLCAPAGFGKSTLLQHWAQQAAERPAWFSVDSADNDLRRFWRYVISAIDLVRPGVAERTADVVKLIHPAQYEVGLTMLLNELSRLERRVVLVLDDFHLVTDDRLLASFAYFLEHLPDSLRLILASRTELAIPTARLLARQLMNRLDTEELRFTAQEGREFYSRCMALDLPEGESEGWVRRTEGWITAMKLAALSLQGAAHSSLLLRNFSGASHLLEQYLLEEVFAGQSEALRRFLLDCSVLKRMNASLCRAVTGWDASQEMLERLERAQLFIISLDERKGWYRFHHLFAEFLQHRLQRTNPERIAPLLEAAGQWCEREGLKEEALDYYLTGKHYERAVGLLEEMTTKMMRVNTLWLSAQFALIPEPILLEHPILYFSYVHSLLLGDDDYGRVDSMMRFAERAYGEKMKEWTEEARNDFWASYYFVKMLYELVVSRDQGRAVHYIKLSKQHKPAGVRLIFAQSKRSGLPSILKEHTQELKELVNREFLVPFMGQLIEMLDEVGLAGSTVACLAEWHYEYDELDKAEQKAKRALDDGDLYASNVTAEALLPARLVLSRVQRIRGLRAEAKETLRTTRRDIIELGMTGALIFCDAELAWLALQEGDPAPADAWMRLYRLDERDEISANRLYEYIYWARFLLHRGRYERLPRLLERMLAFARQADRFYQQIEIVLLQILLLYGTGRTDEALRLLRQTLAVTERNGFVRICLDAGEALAELLAMLLQTQDREPGEEAAPSLGYLRMLLTGFGRSAPAGEPEAGLAPILTKKEQEIFRLLTQRLTNREIAERLGIGHGTVRTHLNNIYSKLYVNGRAEAIRKGRQSGF